MVVETYKRVILTYKAMANISENDRKLHDILSSAGFNMSRPFNKFDYKEDRQVEYSQLDED